jgi:hypothetical protein
VYSRKVDGRILTFGHEGVLFRRSFIMYDRETKSLWIHTMGEAVKGKLKGKQLKFLPSTITTFGQWKKLHPKTTVLTGKKANGFMGAFNLSRDLPRYGLSVGQGRTAKLYPFTLLAEKRVINDEFADEKIVVVYDAKSITGVVYRRQERTFAFKEGKLVDETGTEWDLLAGTAGREKLERLPATPWLTARWRTFYPQGEIHR